MEPVTFQAAQPRQSFWGPKQTLKNTPTLDEERLNSRIPTAISVPHSHRSPESDPILPESPQNWLQR